MRDIFLLKGPHGFGQGAGMETKEYLRRVLEECDAAALANIRAGSGGPFAASLLLHDQAAGAWQRIAGPCGNAVLKTALPTAHAEDQAIAPGNREKLRAALRDLGAEAAHVYLVCNGEPCPACHAKLEIFARQLQAEGLLLPARFTVAYGASYEETCDVAGFDDGAYHRDFLNPPGTGMIRQRWQEREALPQEVLAALQYAKAAVIAEDRIATGDGPMAEIAAIQNLCRRQRAENISTPWDLRRGTVYTTTETIGPLAYAEAQWANIVAWVTIPPRPDSEIPDAQANEAPGIDNAALFRIIATRPYTHKDSALSFLHLAPFANEAQQEWCRMVESGKAQSYNGIK